jgi:hypothetical protein
MTVNPKLATLMRVIDDNQDKMTEGEYLEAMNALAALHREVPVQQQQQPHDEQAPMRPIPVGPPPSYTASAAAGLFASRVPEVMGGNITEARAWERVRNYHPDPFQNRISAEEWMLLNYENRFRLVREATEHYASKKESQHRTPDPKTCPFITRHAVGLWSMEDDGETRWECVCGYTGKVKNWKKHEQSERHQEWATHRTVSRRKIEKMKAMIRDDEAGQYVRFAGYAPNQARLYPGGIRIYTVWQDKNEWTHPDMFAEFHRSPIPVFHLDACGNVGETTTTWFVHPRNIWARQYVQ